MSERDVHFAGFARALLGELFMVDAHGWSEFLQNAEPVVARRVYDLALHIVGETVGAGNTAETFVQSVPDLPQLPEEVKNE